MKEITNHNGTTVGATLVVAHSLVAALKNNKENGTTKDNNDPCDSVTSCNKTETVGDKKTDDENKKINQYQKHAGMIKGNHKGCPYDGAVTHR